MAAAADVVKASVSKLESSAIKAASTATNRVSCETAAAALAAEMVVRLSESVVSCSAVAKPT